MAYTYSRLASTTVGAGGTSAITFSNIPQNYTDLQMFVSVRDNTASTSGNYTISLNGSSTGFTVRRIEASGSTVVSDTGTTWAGYTSANNATVNTFSNNSIYFPNYSGSTNKSYSIDTVQEHNATQAYSGIDAGLWSNVTGINSIKITPTSGSFVQYSTAYLYGIRVEL